MDKEIMGILFSIAHCLLCVVTVLTATVVLYKAFYKTLMRAEGKKGGVIFSGNILFPVMVTFFLLVSSSGVMADEFVIGTDPWPPFTILEESTFTGIDIEVAEEIEKRLTGIKFKFKNIPWSRALLYMEQGKIDAITGLAKREDREKYILYTSPPYYSKCSSQFYVKRGSGVTIIEYEDLYRYRVGFVSNSAYFTQFDNDDKINKISVTNERQLLVMLQYGHIDVLIGTNCQVDYHIVMDNLRGEFEEVEYKPGNNVDLYFGLSKKSDVTELQPLLNNIIQQLHDEGVIQRIADKYFK